MGKIRNRNIFDKFYRPLAVFLRVLVLICISITFTGCNGIKNYDKVDPAGDLSRDDYLALRQRDGGNTPTTAPKPPPIPPLSDLSPASAVRPPASGHDHKVSVSVTDTVPVRDVLLDLGRKADVNLELDPRVQGGVIITAHNRPFPEVLQRICTLAGLRARQDGDYIHIEPDDPYQKTYNLDYLSLARKATSETGIATNVFDVDVTNNSNSGGTNGGRSSNLGTSATENNSTSKISGASEADFWSETEKSLNQILSTTRHGEKTEAKPSFSMDRQSGLVTVYADSRQQAAVESYFNNLRRKATAQVEIDARIVEVELDDGNQSGINLAGIFKKVPGISANFLGSSPASSDVFTARFNTADFTSLIRAVQTFGTTRVLSAPRLTVLNNQTAVLKVATNQVYFVTQAQFTTVTNANGAAVTTTPVYTSTPRTVPVGLVMTVQPSIDLIHYRVTMTLRPTISRIVNEVNDPSIGLNAAQAGVANPVQSQVPVLAVREMDSVIQLHSGEVAIMGGLMQDSGTSLEKGVPGLDTLPVLGNLAKSRDNSGQTTELVILLRATISESPQPDEADKNLYRTFTHDPRPVPLPNDLPPLTEENPT